MDFRRATGQAGEAAAAKYLENEGVCVLLRNFRCKFGEIDLIGKQENSFLVVEVKTRNYLEQGYPCEAVDFRKQRNICRTFDYFRMKYHLDDFTSVRFDVVEVDRNFRCHWIQNAFEYRG